MKILRVGDPHVMVSNLKDSESLMDFVIETAKKEKCEIIEFLGDQFHTHAVLRIEVVDFWHKVFDKIDKLGFYCRVLVGNHDQPGSKEKEQVMNALNIYQPKDRTNSLRTIINKPMILDNIAYIPYMSDRDAFLKASSKLFDEGAKKLLVAHQTFTGAKYDNGFFAEDGIDPDLVFQEKVISGHIHKGQTIGKCEYLGTPKWDTMSDANDEKGIWICEHDEDGSITSKFKISTEDVVTPIYKYIYEEGGEEPKLKTNAKNYIELVGKSAWVTKVKKKYKGKAQIKARTTDRKVTKIDKNDLLSVQKYIENYFEPVAGVNKQDLVEYLGAINE